MNIPEVGNRVHIESLDASGVVNYVDSPTLFQSQFKPIQIELDEPYDESTHRLYRTDLEDITILE